MLRVKPMICLILGLYFYGSVAPGATDAVLPLGDGKISSEPMQGYVYPCLTHFRGGAQHSGDWLGAASWDPARKIHVQGDVPWPDARFTIRTVDGVRQITGNGLPLNHATGVFPVKASDPAYRIDRNPNRIEAQQIVLNLPLSPEVADEASCLPMGMIGITTGGVAIFNALDDAGRDAVAHEVQDRCGGHPQKSGLYHYHGPSPCAAEEGKNNALIGYALDGFGIYGNRDENGKELTNADLDKCHGRTGRIQWGGQQVTMYHYVLTREYPYTLGCFRGRPESGRLPDAGFPAQGKPADTAGIGRRQAPQEAVGACADRALDADCRFVSPRGDTIVGSCRLRDGLAACVPNRVTGMLQEEHLRIN